MFRPKPPKRQVDPVRSSVVFLFRGVSSFPGPMDAEGRVTLFRRHSGTGLLLHRFCASRRCCRSSPAALQVAEQPGGCPLRDSGDAGKGGYGQGAGYTKLRHSLLSSEVPCSAGRVLERKLEVCGVLACLRRRTPAACSEGFSLP